MQLEVQQKFKLQFSNIAKQKRVGLIQKRAGLNRSNPSRFPIGPRHYKTLRFGEAKSFPIGPPHSKTLRFGRVNSPLNPFRSDHLAQKHGGCSTLARQGPDTRPSETAAERGVGPPESARAPESARERHQRPPSCSCPLSSCEVVVVMAVTDSGVRIVNMLL